MPAGITPIGISIPNIRRVDNKPVKIDLKEIRCDGVDCIRLVQDRDQRQAL
jgi:hypothetical protein